MPKRYLAPVLAAALAALLLALWAGRRPSTPEPPPGASTSSPVVVAPTSPAPSPAPPSPDEVKSASTPPSRLELARRCLRLAETDPLAAIDLAIAQNLSADDPGLLPALMLRWAERDFSGALDWTRAQPRDAWRDDILARLAFLRAQTEPLVAAHLVVTDIPSGPARDEAIISVVHQWALRDTEAAGLWAESLDAEGLRQRAVAEVAGVAATRVPSPR